VCERLEGDMHDRCGQYDGVPLGRLEKCDWCGKWACPDCLHEADCCFDWYWEIANEEAGEPVAPPGWRLSKCDPKRARSNTNELIIK
jgi:hypothetical protein